MALLSSSLTLSSINIIDGLPKRSSAIIWLLALISRSRTNPICFLSQMMEKKKTQRHGDRMLIFPSTRKTIHSVGERKLNFCESSYFQMPGNKGGRTHQ